MRRIPRRDSQLHQQGDRSHERGERGPDEQRDLGARQALVGGRELGELEDQDRRPRAHQRGEGGATAHHQGVNQRISRWHTHGHAQDILRTC